MGGGDFGRDQSNSIITFPGVTCYTGATAYVKSTGQSYSLTLPSDWGFYTKAYNAGENRTLETRWYVTPAHNAQEGIYRLRIGTGSTSFYYIQVGSSNTLVWDYNTAVNKKSVNSDVGSSSNPIITFPGFTCVTEAWAYYNSGSGTSYSFTLPSDWGVYEEGYNGGGVWAVIPPTNATHGIYKLKGANGISATYYSYIQVGTSTTLVWDADTATP